MIPYHTYKLYVNPVHLVNAHLALQEAGEELMLQCIGWSCV